MNSLKIPKNVQLNALATGTASLLPKKYLEKCNEMIEACSFKDFINISKRELFEFIDFENSNFVSLGTINSDGYSIIAENNLWVFVITERGHVFKKTYYNSLNEAKEGVVDELWRNAEIQLSHRHRQ